MFSRESEHICLYLLQLLYLHLREYNVVRAVLLILTHHHLRLGGGGLLFGVHGHPAVLLLRLLSQQRGLGGQGRDQWDGVAAGFSGEGGRRLAHAESGR